MILTIETTPAVFTAPELAVIRDRLQENAEDDQDLNHDFSNPAINTIQR